MPRLRMNSERATSVAAREARGPFGLALLCFSAMACLVVSGCVTSFPIEEYALARAAVEAAKDSDAPRYAPNLWYKAEEAYQQGQREYKERSYSKARDAFIEAKYHAERAENAARLQRFQSGDAVP